jgi:hypothetical protein
MGDGNLELIGYRDFTQNESGSHCVAGFPVVYAWDHGKYADVSSRYKPYYVQELASLQQQIAKAETAKERFAEGLPPEGSSTSDLMSQMLQARIFKAPPPFQPLPANSPAAGNRHYGYVSCGVHWSFQAKTATRAGRARAGPARVGLHEGEAAKIERFL